MATEPTAPSPLHRLAAAALIVGGLLWMLHTQSDSWLSSLPRLNALVRALTPMLLALGLGCLWAGDRPRPAPTGRLAAIADPAAPLGLGLAGVGTLLLSISTWQALIERTPLPRASAGGLGLLLAGVILLTLGLFRARPMIVPLGGVSALLLAHVAWALVNPSRGLLELTRAPFFYPDRGAHALDLWFGTTWLLLGADTLVRLMPRPVASAAPPTPARLPRLAAWFGLVAVVLFVLPVASAFVLDPLPRLFGLLPSWRWPSIISQSLSIAAVGALGLSYLLFAGATLLLTLGDRRQMGWRGWLSLATGAMGPAALASAVAVSTLRPAPPQFINGLLLILVLIHPGVSTALLAWELHRRGHGHARGTTTLLAAGLCGTLLVSVGEVAGVLPGGRAMIALNMALLAVAVVILGWACFSASLLWRGSNAPRARAADAGHPAPIQPAGEMPPA